MLSPQKLCVSAAIELCGNRSGHERQVWPQRRRSLRLRSHRSLAAASQRPLCGRTGPMRPRHASWSRLLRESCLITAVQLRLSNAVIRSSQIAPDGNRTFAARQPDVPQADVDNVCPNAMNADQMNPRAKPCGFSVNFYAPVIPLRTDFCPVRNLCDFSQRHRGFIFGIVAANDSRSSECTVFDCSPWAAGLPQNSARKPDKLQFFVQSEVQGQSATPWRLPSMRPGRSAPPRRS
jgi:hypothetical protein